MTEVSDGRSSRSIVEVEFEIHDSTYPFVGASEREACTFELAEMIPRPNDRFAEFFNVTGTDPGRIVSAADGRETVDVTLLSSYEDGGLFEFLVSGDCPAVDLARQGALPRDVRGENGEGSIVAEIPSAANPSTVIESFLKDHPAAEFVAKREKDAVAPRYTETGIRRILTTHLTDRQQEVVRAAFDAGYYDWPRECTGEDVAEQLDISSATFSEHIHAAERKLFALLFDRPRAEASGGS